MPLISDLLDSSHKKILRPSGGCHNCPRRRVDFVPATLKSTPLIYVGEAPGEQEVVDQEGFVGSSGRYLRAASEEVGITEFSLTNAIHCRPPENATPSAVELERCLSEFVLDEIRGYPMVVLVGNTALRTIFPGAKASRYRGNVAHHPDFPGQRFYSIYHPAYILRRRDKEPSFRKHMKRLGRIMAGEGAPTWRVLQGGGEEFWAKLEKALAAPMISLDLETDRLQSWQVGATIRSLALTADGEDVLFAHHEEAHFLAVLIKVKEYLEQIQKHVVGMNIGFDLDFLEREMDFQVRASGRHDVATIFYEAKQYKMPSLKELVAEELDGYRYLVYKPHEETDLGLLANYNAEDVVHPLELFRKGMQLLKPKTRDLVTRVSGPTGHILRKMTTNGIYLRQGYRKEKIAEYQEKRKETLAAWREADPAFIPTEHESGKGLRKYLFEIRGLPVNHKTETGEPSTEATAIKAWIRSGETYLEHLLELRRIDKIQSTYLTAYDKHLGEDGRIHSEYTNTFTDTGRPSSRKPNLQNIPRDPEIRDLFGVPPGHVLLESDLSQIEFRIMISRARDRNGIEAYLRGEDAHTQTAKSFAPNPTKEHRTWAKVINFSLLYGGDAYKVQQWARDQYGLDWSIEQAQEFVDAFWSTYPALPHFHAECRRRLKENRGWFESVTGHVYHYQDWDHPNQKKREHIENAAINSEAQGPAAQIMFYIMIHAARLMQERNLSARMVNTVHDSVLLEIPSPDLVSPVIHAIEDAKEIAYEWIKPWFLVPLEMDHEIGESWGSLEDWKESTA